MVSVPSPIASGTPLVFGDETFTFGQEAAELVDSSALRNDPAALRERLAEDGYLFIRGFHPRETAMRAARFVLRAIGERGALAPGTDPAEGVVGPERRSFGFFREVAVAHAPEMLAVTDGAHTFRFFERFFGEPVMTFDKRWLRAMATGGHNHFHYDSVYVGRGTHNRVTMWSALTEIGLENGPLVLCLGSHRDERLKSTYGATDMDRDLTDAVFSKDPRELVGRFGFRLATTHFQPGDAVIFGLFMMHSSLPNRSDRYRISVDTRYQPASEPSDERFHGADGQWLGNFHNKGATYRPMDELRREWGLE